MQHQGTYLPLLLYARRRRDARRAARRAKLFTPVLLAHDATRRFSNQVSRTRNIFNIFPKLFALAWVHQAYAKSWEKLFESFATLGEDFFPKAFAKSFGQNALLCRT